MSGEYNSDAAEKASREHTPEHPFCYEMDCLCHEDEENMAMLQGWHNDGLVGSVDGDLIYRGKTI